MYASFGKEEKTMKKFTATLLCLFMVLALTACGNNKSSDQTESTPYDTSPSETLSKDEQALVDTLTPEGSEIIENVQGHLVMNSNKSVDELAAFYENAVEQLGAQPPSDSRNNDWWIYNGTYGKDNRTLFIQVGRTGETTAITVNY